MNAADALARGESVPGGPGACATCGHLTLWHRPPRSTRSYHGQPCQKCDCSAFTAPGDTPPAPAASRPRRKAPAAAATPPPGQLALFSLDEVS